MRNLILVLGDQLDHESAAFDGFDPKDDAVWMAEVEEEATHVHCHRRRLAFFFAAMRHFRDQLEEDGRTVHYHQLDRPRAEDRGKTFRVILRKDVHNLRPEKLIVVEPGDYRVREALRKQAKDSEVELEFRQDRHFYCGLDEFAEWADGRKSLLLESFYREMRKRHGILLRDGEPEGGEWNYDEANRETFGKDGPDDVPKQPSFSPDKTTAGVLEMVEERYADHPGSLDGFDLPVTQSDAKKCLKDFVTNRLPDFGRYQDALAAGEDFLYHSRLSAVLNVKLLSPRKAVDAAVEAYRAGDAPLNSVEGFVRQILGWREYVRGIYWLKMPAYIELNELECEDLDVPSFYWDGETEMRCVAEAMRNVVANGYAHHIQRLMVLGLFAQLLGVHPRKFHDWHMAMYVDAIDWVSLPNTLGMSQYGDGGIVGTKPYCASGNYINRMSDYCSGCRYDPKKAAADEACPFTALYWDFLDRHRKRFEGNRRMTLQLKNLQRKNREESSEILETAARVKEDARRGRL